MMLKKLKLSGSVKRAKPSRVNIKKKKKKKKVHFIIRYWNAKVGSQEIPRITGKNSLTIQSEEGQRLTEFCQENTMVIANTLSNNSRDNSTCEHHQMLNSEIRLIMFFAVEDGEALYSQQK